LNSSRKLEAPFESAGLTVLDAAGQDDFAAVARLVRPQGRRGEVIAEILTDLPGRLQSLREAYLENPGGAPAAVHIESAWPHKGRMVFKFRGIESISEAEALRGLHVLISRSERPPLAGGSYYISDLIGCRVVALEDGKERGIGTVTGVEGAGSALRLEVKPLGSAAGELLIPFAQEICTRVDTESRTIVVNPPEDLLELNKGHEPQSCPEKAASRRGAPGGRPRAGTRGAPTARGNRPPTGYRAK
jgi:16S rRNA processing protein RimM